MNEAKPETITMHIDHTPGLITEEPDVEEIHSAHGQHYFKATARIGALFGSEVEGFLTGYGRTREDALKKLADERTELYESLW